MALSLTRFVRNVAAVVAAGALSTTVSAGAPAAAAEVAPAAGAAPVAVAARPADSLVDSYGLGVHLAYGSTPYANVAGITRRLEELGVRHLRTRFYPGREDTYTTMRALAAKGIRFNLIMGTPTSAQSPADLVGAVSRELPSGVVESLEGANEWNLTGRPNWAAELRGHQIALWRAAKANPGTAGLPVLAPALGKREGFAELGDLSAYADYGNNHLYPGGMVPSTRIDAHNQQERLVVGDKPMMYTEAGYHNAMNNSDTHLPTPEGVAGVYMPRLLLEHYLRGTKRLYTYELLDQRPDPHKEDREANFGLVRNDLSPKPAYTALQNLLKLTADPGAAFKPGALSYTVEGAPTDLRQVLLQKRDGRFYLLLWRDVSIYDRIAEKTLPVANDALTVRLATPATVTSYRPSTSAAPVATRSGVTEVPLSLGGDVTALEISSVKQPVVTVPSAPSGVSAVAGDASATVRWSAPGSTGGSPVTSYEVVAAPGGAKVTASGSATTATVTGLTTGTAHTFTVRATNAAGTGAASAPSSPVTPLRAATAVRVVEDTVARLGGWRMMKASTDNGGMSRTSRIASDVASFRFTGTAVTWRTRVGRDQGKALVRIDGVAKETVDLYRATAGTTSKTYGGLAAGTHTITVEVLGTKNAAATGTDVAIDAFVVGAATTQESSPSLSYGSWMHAVGPASGGTYRVSGVGDATTALLFTGTGIEWVTATGPSYGKAEVFIDGASRGVVDLSARTQTWGVTKSWKGLKPGEHTIEVKVLGRRGALSGRSAVMTDAFRVHA
jgi:hypothetical protein